ncbi:SRPBCC family protein [Halorussus litoreus]|uniref:SRPBCC family protein n=1 Tax=Halorussus litoreus TaxID=1710536 RepID=UPI000E27D325|nr:SRPBCC family protein [Halorussus litoreus]
MDSVTVSRQLDAHPDEVAELVTELEPFVRAAGFDEVAVDGEEIRVANEVRPKRIELVLDTYDAPGTVLAYEQREGIFETMTTEYALEPADGGMRVVATTEFALDAAVVGSLLDATVIKMQRKRELTAQFDYLADRLDG